MTNSFVIGFSLVAAFRVKLRNQSRAEKYFQKTQIHRNTRARFVGKLKPTEREKERERVRASEAEV